MKGALIAGSLAFASAVLANPAVKRQSGDNTPAVSVKGNGFYTPDGKRFFIRGVDYQPGGASQPVDPIANAGTCKRDIQEFQNLGINTVRVYSVDNTANHDECMQALSAAGIYLILDVNSGKYSINRNDPVGSYNDVYLQSVFATIDAFKNYDNTLAFFSGNEVINAANNTNTAPYIKAQSKRAIPVGYSAADVESNRVQTAQYMNCGPDSDRADLFAFNDYSWCSPSSFTLSGWNQRVQEYQSYSIPIFFSEFGCNTNQPRTFDEVGTLYGPQMNGVFSGGLVYEYSEEGSHYGLVQITSDTSVTENDEFQNLKSAYQNTPQPTDAPAANPSGAASTCPTPDANWQPGFPNGQLPAMPGPAQQFLQNGAGGGPGLNGPGSQDTGVASTANTTENGNSVTTGTGKSAAVQLAPMSWAPLVVSTVVVSFSLLGSGLLL